MILDKVIVSLGGFGLIVFVWWFFFGKKSSFSEATSLRGKIDIVVEGGYKPSTIKIKNGKNAALTFVRKDPNSCLEEVIFPEFKITKYLPLNKPVEVILKPVKAGVFEFHCSMNMFKGKIIVEA